jgi:Flp pilus assembly protein protease CpaA
VWLYAAVRDRQTKHVPNHVWSVLLAVALLRALYGYTYVGTVILSVLLVWPLGIVLWKRYNFGGADAKALMVSATLYPENIGVFIVVTGILFFVLDRGESETTPVIPAFAGAAVVVALLLLA